MEAKKDNTPPEPFVILLEINVTMENTIHRMQQDFHKLQAQQEGLQNQYTQSQS